VADTPRRELDLTDPGTVRAVARRAQLGAKHRLGQHFLVDAEVRAAIVEALAPAADDTVLEIGPGMGTLTQAMAPACRRLVAVEIDPACIRAAHMTLRGLDNVEIVQGDAMRVDLEALGLPDPFLACGNLPYNLTAALLSRLFESRRPPARAAFLVQREVAARLAGGPGDWSLATVAIRSIAEVERVRDVAPASFTPVPAVWSSIIRMTPAAVMAEEDRRHVLSLARAAFQVRRKTLRHGVANALDGDLAAAEAALGRAGIDSRRRPETLALEEWRVLARAVGGP
jgi:16S rRNA (adenine1518-N6/adenine1519-N6)-dimethyltransferase